MDLAQLELFAGGARKLVLEVLAVVLGDLYVLFGGNLLQISSKVETFNG